MANLTIDVAATLQNDDLLTHECKTVSKSALHLPGSDFVDRVMAESDRNPATLRNMQLMLNTGRLAGTGYVSILPTTSTPRTSSSSRSKAGATPSPRPTASSAPWRASTPTRSPSWSSSTTTS